MAAWKGRSTARILSLAICLVALAPRAAGQSLSGEIAVTVVDRTDAVIPNAKIIVSRAGTAETVKTWLQDPPARLALRCWT